jgi:hypothetical protein
MYVQFGRTGTAESLQEKTSENRLMERAGKPRGRKHETERTPFMYSEVDR